MFRIAFKAGNATEYKSSIPSSTAPKSMSSTEECSLRWATLGILPAKTFNTPDARPTANCSRNQPPLSIKITIAPAKYSPKKNDPTIDRVGS